MDKLIEEIKKHAKNGKIPCKVALKLSEEYGKKSSDIGKKLNELKIKVVGCQLGCFK